MQLPLSAYAKLAKYLNVQSSDITAPMVVDIAGALGQKLEPGDVNIQEITGALAASDVSRLSDLLGREELFPKIVELFRAKSADKTSKVVTRLCPVCDTTMSVTIGPAERQAQVVEMGCTTCDAQYLLTSTGLLPKE